jgi:hypothetical protein
VDFDKCSLPTIVPNLKGFSIVSVLKNIIAPEKLQNYFTITKNFVTKISVMILIGVFDILMAFHTG